MHPKKIPKGLAVLAAKHPAIRLPVVTCPTDTWQIFGQPKALANRREPRPSLESSAIQNGGAVGIRKNNQMNKACALYALQQPLLSNWNKWNKQLYVDGTQQPDQAATRS
jgi:hypothetical protein